jgi:hypothetical protein
VTKQQSLLEELGLERTPCRCGRKIVFGETEDGHLIPLDPAPPVYFFDKEARRWKRARNGWVSHYATCKFANQFSKRKNG